MSDHTVSSSSHAGTRGGENTLCCKKKRGGDAGAALIEGAFIFSGRYQPSASLPRSDTVSSTAAAFQLGRGDGRASEG